MPNDRQVQISCTLLEEIVQCLEAATIASPTTTETQKLLITRVNRAIAAATSLMRGSAGPGNFSGNEIGLNGVDPSQSPFL